jgi:hypothetical protein
MRGKLKDIRLMAKGKKGETKAALAKRGILPQRRRDAEGRTKKSQQINIPQFHEVLML